MILYNGGIRIPEIAVWFSYKYALTVEYSENFIHELIARLEETESNNQTENQPEYYEAGDSVHYYSTRYYSINTASFCFHFETRHLESLFDGYFFIYHTAPAPAPVHYRFFIREDSLIITKNGVFLGSWTKERFADAKGKLFGDLLNLIYGRTEDNWVAVFHAASLAFKGYSVLFPGLSGSGKSILSLILQAKGFEILSDDFSPLGDREMHLYKFPGTIGVHPQIAERLASSIPVESVKAAEEPENEKIRVIPARFTKYTESGYPVRAVVFVCYKEGAGFTWNYIKKDSALERLIPDTWISPKKENVAHLLNWIEQIPCYEIVYSDNHKMCLWVEKIITSEPV